jgi:APA family basic amino acid/polyamine antiporter
LFSDIHPKWLTPWKSNLLFCVAVSLMAAFLPMTVVGEMTSIGTLFAFVVVCAAVLIMRRTNPDRPRPFRTPWVPLIPIAGIVWNFAMMLTLGWSNWARLVAWFIIGQVIFFTYSRKHSHLTAKATSQV